MHTHRSLVLFLLVALIAAGCASEKSVRTPVEPGPDYGRPLPPGESALRLVTDPSRMPDLRGVYRNRDALLLDAIDESLRWFKAPSSRHFYPFEGVTHDQNRASLLAMKRLLESADSADAFVARVREHFDVYESVGYDGSGIVLFTGYYAPIFRASREPTARFTHPLYTRPDDLVTDPVTGEPQGRRLPDGSIAPYATRREIESTNRFAGSELVWLEDSLSAYIIHVNGSAKLRLRDGEVMYIGYAGKTDRPYASLGRALVDAGLLDPGAVSLSAIKRLHGRKPEAVEEAMLANENYVFFTEYDGGNWPAGSLGVRVTPESSLATDKSIYPRGGLVIVDTQAVTVSRGTRRFLKMMLDQDTGGAIKAPGRADIFMGIGPGAEVLAGGQYSEGRLYYLVLKPDLVDEELAAASVATE